VPTTLICSTINYYCTNCTESFIYEVKQRIKTCGMWHCVRPVVPDVSEHCSTFIIKIIGPVTHHPTRLKSSAPPLCKPWRGKTKHFVPFCYIWCPEQDSLLIPDLECLFLLNFNIISIMSENWILSCCIKQRWHEAGHNMEQF